MATPMDAAPAHAGAAVLRWTAHALLLVPEATLIAALLCAYWGMGAPAGIGLAIMLVIIGFIARLIALVAAQSALAAGHLHEAKRFVQAALALYPWSADALAL